MLYLNILISHIDKGSISSAPQANGSYLGTNAFSLFAEDQTHPIHFPLCPCGGTSFFRSGYYYCVARGPVRGSGNVS